MHLLSGGRLSMRRRIYYPDAGKGETFELPVSCALFRHPQGNALFDTGCHPDAAVDGAARWGAAARYSPPIFNTEDAVVHQLPAAGLSADDIDVVLCSHLHYDHCGCNAFFKRATVILHAKELAAARAADAEAMGYLRNDWDVGARIETVEAAFDVFGDGRLTLLPAPGHTPGMMIAHAVLDRSGAFVLASDAVPVADCLSRRYAPQNTVDEGLFLRSIDEIVRLQDGGAHVLFGHDDAQWSRLRKGADHYD
jgi:N-acyl homoserine lactone hydrolase